MRLMYVRQPEASLTDNINYDNNSLITNHE